MLAYDFMLRAFAAGGMVAVVAAATGYFLVLRGQVFAGHALSHIGFAGATGAALLGVPPLAGVAAITLAAGVGIGLLGEKLTGRDVATGVILALALALGLLFLSLNKTTVLQATSILFGNVLAVAPAMLGWLAGLAALALAALAAISRPLLFASLQPELAEAKGVSLRLIGALFMAVVALAVALAVQVVGVLLVFVLMVGPPAAAQLLTRRLWPGIGLAVALGLAETWLGVALAWETGWPTSFCIAALSALAYFAALGARRGSS